MNGRDNWEIGLNITKTLLEVYTYHIRDSRGEGHDSHESKPSKLQKDLCGQNTSLANSYT